MNSRSVKLNSLACDCNRSRPQVEIINRIQLLDQAGRLSDVPSRPVIINRIQLLDQAGRLSDVPSRPQVIINRILLLDQAGRLSLQSSRPPVIVSDRILCIIRWPCHSEGDHRNANNACLTRPIVLWPSKGESLLCETWWGWVGWSAPMCRTMPSAVTTKYRLET